MRLAILLCVAVAVAIGLSVRVAGGESSGSTPARPAPGKAISKEVTVAASRAEVWKAWTTNEGAQTFFAPKTNIELAFGGMYEVLFRPDAPAGQRGDEGTHTLSYVQGEMVSFEWSFPPSIPSLRNAGVHTFVVIQLADAGEGRTRVRLTHAGWCEGEDWDKGYAYFESAWDIVLGRLVERFEKGPLDWKAMGR